MPRGRRRAPCLENRSRPAPPFPSVQFFLFRCAFMPLPAAKDGFSLADFKVARAIGSIYKGAPIVVIHEPVLEQIIEYSESGRSREVGGFLLGGTYGEDHTFV